MNERVVRITKKQLRLLDSLHFGFDGDLWPYIAHKGIKIAEWRPDQSKWIAIKSGWHVIGGILPSRVIAPDGTMVPLQTGLVSA